MALIRRPRREELERLRSIEREAGSIPADAPRVAMRRPAGGDLTDRAFQGP
jgi:hypothetical protein